MPTSPTTPIPPSRVTDLVRAWVDEAARFRVPSSASMLAGLLKDPHGLDFTVAFADRVMRAEDPRVAAHELRLLAADPPAFLPAPLSAALRAGGASSGLAPAAVVPVVRAAMRRLVSHLILDARDPHLAQHIRRLHRDGFGLNLNLLGETVLGDREAERRLEGVGRLLRRDDVDYVSIKLSSIIHPLDLWARPATAARAETALLPLYRYAATARSEKFINLDMEEYSDLDLTIGLFTALLDRPELQQLRAGIVLQAYLPDSLAAFEDIQDWAARRVANGGAPVKVRIVKGANLAMEKVDSALTGHELATFGSKEETDAQYKRILDRGLDPTRLSSTNIGMAGHNLFDVARAHLLVKDRDISSGVEFEMLAGMAPGQAQAVRRTVGPLRLYVPVVSPAEFDTAISYLVRRLEENASSENFMSAVFELGSDAGLFERERARFERSQARSLEPAEATHRTQDREALISPRPDPGGDGGPTSFVNEPDTDISRPANQDWAARITARVQESTLGRAGIATARIDDLVTLESVLSTAHEGGRAWGGVAPARRAAILRDAADLLGAHRADLLEVAAGETGKTLREGDPEVSEAVDFARYYAACADLLEADPDVVPVPRSLTLVAPPWNFPISIPCGSITAALAAGSGVVVKPAPQARYTAAVLVEALWEAGVPRSALTLVDVDEDEIGRTLVSDPRFDQVVLTGAYETAELFASWRPGMRIQAETSGKNSIIVTPSADLDLAARDVAASAFGYAGQKCSAASLVIVVGSVGASRRFQSQLADAVRSLRVGLPTDPTAVMGPLIQPAEGKPLRAFTDLGPGESWLLKPEKLSADGRLWSPGVRNGVRPGSEFHLTEYFAPVLGIMRAKSLEEAVALQNQPAFGLTAGIQSLDVDEIEYWAGHVEAGNLYVNRTITGAVVQRQPFGGWKRSVVGPGTKAGGPDYVASLSGWRDTDDALVRRDPAGWLARALEADRREWDASFSRAVDVQHLGVERNILRYRTVPAVLRLGAGLSEAQRSRLLAAALLPGGPIAVSSATELTEPASRRLGQARVPLVIEGSEDFAARLTSGDVATARSGVDGDGPVRVRIAGEERTALDAALGSRVDLAVHDGAPTIAGRREVLVYLQEQAVSLTNHRFGDPLPREAVIPPLV